MALNSIPQSPGRLNQNGPPDHPVDVLPSSLLDARRVLLVPFEDRALLASVREQMPVATVTVVAKSDLAGLSLAQMIRLVRSNRYDAAIVSGAGSTIRRHSTSLELLLCVARARRRYLRTQESPLHEASRASIVLQRFPLLVAGVILGGIAFTVNWLCALTVTDAPRDDVPVARPSGQRTILFLRADLPGPLRAGGSVSHVKGIVDAFTRSGHRVVYVAEARHPGFAGSVDQVIVRPFTFLGFFDEFQQLAYNMQLMWVTRRIVRAYRPDLLYQRHTVFSFAGGWAARRAGVPSVLEVNASEVWVKKHWSRLTFERLAVICEDVALKLATRIAVISEGVRDQLQPYQVAASRLVIVPNGVDPNEFRPDLDGSSVRKTLGLEGTTVVGFIGTFTRWHGVETLRDAILQLCPDDDTLRFLLIGDGDLRSAMQQSIEESGRADRCRFTGLVAHDEVPTHLAACDIVVSPHLGFEDGTPFFGSPTKIFEYMAMGKPIVASRLAQIADVIRDGVNGLTFEPGNSEELASQIRQLQGNPALAQQMGHMARQDAERQYTWDRTAARAIEGLA